ncbi:IS110 family transposase [Streptomyces sp. AgN23]|uniref:IS110 family transposase n=1 Tax=Streptomyces sp. AgN23 TaxID=1188315 RepID=UPI001FF11363|nr:IS110 family transposase [Streptomyces sp. AgN23]
MAQIWAGTGIGKTHHHCVVLTAQGERLLSRRVLNDEPELLALLADVLALGQDVAWAVDVADGMAALWINVLLNHGQHLVYIPGLAVNRASAGYRGMGRTDAKDATVIADQARMRRDLTVLLPDDEHAIELRVLTSRRTGLNADRTRRVNRLRGQLFRDHGLADVIASMPGIGPLLGAEFLAATAGDMSRYGTADRLASLAGVSPLPRDSGNVSGNLHRPRRYHRGLQRVFYTSAPISIRGCDDSRRFYERKRSEGKRHTQAVLALARRRVNVLWALIRDGQCYQSNLRVTSAA